MSIKRSFSEQAMMVILIVLVAFLALALTQSIFMFVFAPIVVYLLWSYSRRIKDLENRVAELDGLSTKKSETPGKTREKDGADKRS